VELDAGRCYQAILSRDARFDGRFFTGVVTTGVYCRPVCPVRPPRLENMRFFACAAAAEEAGFRPCRRCRPETSPGTPAWLGSSAAVSRALHLINEGALDGGSVDDLGHRLGIGGRQLRRLFARHLGASPLAVARTRRAHFARRLVDETAMSMADVAFAAGFQSIRSFNQTMQATFRLSPTELRRGDLSRTSSMNGEGLVVRVAYRPPFDWDGLVEFLSARVTRGVEAVSPAAYTRTVSVDGAPGVITVHPEPGRPCLLLRVQLPGYRGLIGTVERVRRVFDLGADPLTINSSLARDPRLAPLVALRPGLRVLGAWDGFELAVRAVLGQQVSVRAATTLAGRLARAHGKPVAGFAEHGLTHLFPDAATLAEADLSGIGLTSARIVTIRALATAVAGGTLTFDASAGLDEAVARLTAVPGIGPWTAQYVAMRALGEPDAFPVSDLGLRRAASASGRPLSVAELAELAERWRPWRAYAAMHLWRSSTAHPVMEEIAG